MNNDKKSKTTSTLPSLERLKAMKELRRCLLDLNFLIKKLGAEAYINKGKVRIRVTRVIEL